MTSDGRDIVDQAIDWHLRQSGMTADEWRAFTLWIDASPAHAAAYDSVAFDDSLLDIGQRDKPVLPVAANDHDAFEPSRTQRFSARRWGAGGALAAACALLLLPMARHKGSDYYRITTQAGQHQELALGDGTRIELSGGTRMRLDRNDPRFAELMAGEATFHVHHDSANPFTLHSGDLAIRDLGTVFNVARAGQRLDLQVAEGSVMFQPDREAVTLNPGGALTVMEDSKQIMISHVDTATVGGWRTGSLSFAATPLGDVAKAIERQSGLRLSLALPLAAKPFTGMIRLTGSADRDTAHIAALIGAVARREGQGWMLEPVGHAAP